MTKLKMRLMIAVVPAVLFAGIPAVRSAAVAMPSFPPAAMSVTTAQKQSMIARAMDIARKAADFKKEYTAFKQEYDAEDYGNATTGITTAVLVAYAPSADLTNTEFTSGVAAMDTIATSVTTNQTNLYKIAKTP